MSDILKIGAKQGKLNIKIKSLFEIDQSGKNENDLFQKQIDESYRSGFEAGAREASGKSEKKYSELLSEKYEELNILFSSVDEKLNQYEKDFEILALNTAFIIAEKILKREIEKESIINEMLRESVKKILGANNIVIKINPADLKEMNEESRNMFKEENNSKIKFEENESIERGGCFVETEIGNVDGRISSQLNELKKELENSITQIVLK